MAAEVPRARSVPARSRLRGSLEPELPAMMEDLAEAIASPPKRPGVIEAAMLSYCNFHG